jgi:protease-4
MKKRNYQFLIGLLIGFSMALILALLGLNISAGNQIAIIRVNGVITSSPTLLQESTTPDTFASLVESAESNPSIKAVLFQINSPGGSVVASREMVSTIKSMKKPNLCWMGDVAASGGYWVSSACDHIMSDPLSLTGSVGVTASYLSFENLFEKYGIEYEQITSGERKDIGSPFRNLTSEEREKLQYIVEETYKYFIADIIASRNLSQAQVEEINSGDIYLGKDALDLGLVDSLGSFSDSKEKIRELARLDHAEFVVLEPKGLSLLDLLGGF